MVLSQLMKAHLLISFVTFCPSESSSYETAATQARPDYDDDEMPTQVDPEAPTQVGLAFLTRTFSPPLEGRKWKEVL